MEKQKAKLLPIGYYHAVFTVASELRLLFAYNRRLLYGLLFKVSSNLLKEYGQNPKWLGARIGFIGVLHTWGQQMIFHPHIHYIVTAGGLNQDGQWVHPKQGGDFLFPVVELSERFKKELLAAIGRLHRQGRLRTPGNVDVPELLKKAEAKAWEIFLQPPMKTPDKLLKYLGRYTHRVAMSPSRILEVNSKEVRFQYRDYRQKGQIKMLKLSGVEFLKRFLQHVLPAGFRRIRHYGLLHSAAGSSLERARTVLRQEPADLLAALSQGNPPGKEELPSGPACPQCEGPMIMESALRIQPFNSS